MTRHPQRSPGRPTLDAVAARAGVGRGTASRVINGSSQVSAAARAAVEAAAAELGYVPGRSRRPVPGTGAVAVVTSERMLLAAGFLRGISGPLHAAGLQVWLTVTTPPERQLTAQHVDGVLLLSSPDDDPLPALLLARRMPFVQVDPLADGPVETVARRHAERLLAMIGRSPGPDSHVLPGHPPGPSNTGVN